MHSLDPTVVVLCYSSEEWAAEVSLWVFSQTPQ